MEVASWVAGLFSVLLAAISIIYTSRDRKVAEGRQSLEDEAVASSERVRSEMEEVGSAPGESEQPSPVSNDQAEAMNILAATINERVTEETRKLRATYEDEVSRVRRSSNRVALWTFVGGIVLGIIGNFLIALIVK